jgi:hypothetical protein
LDNYLHNTAEVAVLQQKTTQKRGTSLATAHGACPSCHVDHVIALGAAGEGSPSNMQ